MRREGWTCLRTRALGCSPLPRGPTASPTTRRNTRSNAATWCDSCRLPSCFTEEIMKLLFFARLREDLGCAEETIVLPAGVDTVAGLRAYLMGRGSVWRQALAPGRALGVAVNQDMAQPGTPVKPGDEVAFFPPVTGG